jgi:hypothetical protein
MRINENDESVNLIVDRNSHHLDSNQTSASGNSHAGSVGHFYYTTLPCRLAQWILIANKNP